MPCLQLLHEVPRQRAGRTCTVVECLKKEMNADQHKRKLLSEARAVPPLISGTIVSSSTGHSKVQHGIQRAI